SCRPNQSKPKVCVGDACTNWSTTHADFCQQFDPTHPNLAYQATSQSGDFTFPIHIYYGVIQRSPAGIDLPETAEQHRHVDSTGLILPTCHSAIVGGQIYTQRLHLHCETNRDMTSSSTSADCNVGEKLDK